MITNVLNIFGYCFIFELFILVTVVFSSILRSFVDRKEKEKNYKYMVKNEEKLRKQASEEKTKEKERNIKDIIEFVIDKDTGKLEYKEPVNLEKESVEFKIKSIDIEPEEGSKMRRGNYEIDFIPISYVGDSKKQYSYSTIQIPLYTWKEGKIVPSGETESVTVNFEIDPETGEYINSSSKSIHGIHLMCLITKDISEEEKRESDFNKKLTTSEKAMNELLENAVSEGYNTNKSSKNEYFYELWNEKDIKVLSANIKNYDKIKDEFEFKFNSCKYIENGKEVFVDHKELNDDTFIVAFNNEEYVLRKIFNGNILVLRFNPAGDVFIDRMQSSDNIRAVTFSCIQIKE